jgi:hypothetical protein
LQILENSAVGIVTIEEYSVSGIPSYSESILIKLRANSEDLSPSIKIIKK